MSVNFQIAKKRNKSNKHNEFIDYMHMIKLENWVFNTKTPREMRSLISNVAKRYERIICSLKGIGIGKRHSVLHPKLRNMSCKILSTVLYNYVGDVLSFILFNNIRTVTYSVDKGVIKQSKIIH